MDIKFVYFQKKTKKNKENNEVPAFRLR